MIRLHTILVATDFSEPAGTAVTYACTLAERLGGTVHVLHVVPDVSSLPWTAEAYGARREELTAEMQRGAGERLERVLSAEDRERCGATLHVREGRSVFVEIVRYAREQNVDLIVVGTHGRGAVAHALLGSVAEQVVRMAPCPVLTVRHPQHEFVMP